LLALSDNVADQSTFIELKSLTPAIKRETLLEIGQYNLQAANLASHSIAYSSSLSYLKMGLSCLRYLYTDEDELWKNKYELAFTLHKSLASTYETLGDIENSSVEIDLLLQRANNKIDLGNIYAMRIRQLNQLTRGVEAVEVGREALKIFGINIPEGTAEILQLSQGEVAKVETWLNNVLEESKDRDIIQHLVESLPKENDDEKLVIFNIMCAAVVSGFLADPVFFTLIVPLALQTATSNALTPEGPIAFCFMAVLLISMSKPRLGTVCGELGMRLSREVFPNSLPQKTNVLHVYHVFVLPWYRPLREMEPISRELYAIGQECGELQFPGYMSTMLITNNFYRGDTFDQQLAEYPKYEAYVLKTKNIVSSYFFPALRLVIGTLIGTRDCFDSTTFTGIERDLESMTNPYAYATFEILKLTVKYIIDDDAYDDFETYVRASWEKSKAVSSLLPFITSLYTNIIHAFIDSLLLVRLLSLTKDKELDIKAEMNEKIDQHVKNLEMWAELCPSNCKNKLLLVRAERCAYIQDKPIEALQLYDQSLEFARKEGFTQEVALAFELAGKYAHSNSVNTVAHTYLKSALKTYWKWGAVRKVNLMLKRYSFLQDPRKKTSHQVVDSSEKLSLVRKKNVEDNKETKSGSDTNTTVSMPSAAFDLENVMRASEIISSAINMQDLLINIMKTIMETAGASHGAVIVNNKVEAQCDNADQRTVSVMNSLPLDSWPHGCQPAIDYVSRTREPLVIANALEDQQYGFVSSHPYIVTNQVKSLLVMPVLRNYELKAVLYLENNLIENCFTMERINVLRVLTGQMAISIENSRYFTEQLKAAEEVAKLQHHRVLEAQLYRRKQEEFIDRKTYTACTNIRYLS
jgi:hypothetical protein